MVIHKWKVWVVRIAFLCGLLIISSTLQTEAATKNSWTVKVNNEYKAKLVKKKDQWYLQSTSIQMKNKKGTERIGKNRISFCTIQSGTCQWLLLFLGRWAN